MAKESGCVPNDIDSIQITRSELEDNPEKVIIGMWKVSEATFDVLQKCQGGVDVIWEMDRCRYDGSVCCGRWTGGAQTGHCGRMGG